MTHILYLLALGEKGNYYKLRVSVVYPNPGQARILNKKGYSIQMFIVPKVGFLGV